MGYSSRLRLPTTRQTARFLPSGDQSASCALSRISRGEPPAERHARQRPRRLVADDEVPVERDGDLAGRGDREHRGARQVEGAGLGAVRPRREDLERAALPGGAVDDRLAVGSKRAPKDLRRAGTSAAGTGSAGAAFAQSFAVRARRARPRASERSDGRQRASRGGALVAGSAAASAPETEVSVR